MEGEELDGVEGVVLEEEAGERGGEGFEGEGDEGVPLFGDAAAAEEGLDGEFGEDGDYELVWEMRISHG